MAMTPARHHTAGRFVGRLVITDHPPRNEPALARFLHENQCRHCLGWTLGARRLAEQIAGRRGHMRPCVCGRTIVATGQEELDFGGAA
jgi:hypothetical protein